MCGLCGVLGAEDHWTDAAGNTRIYGDGDRHGEAGRTRRQERLRRVAIGNKILARYGLSLSDWQGTSYILRNRTGGQRIVPHMTALWPAAEALAGRPCDPLDPEVVGAMTIVAEGLPLPAGEDGAREAGG